MTSKTKNKDDLNFTFTVVGNWVMMKKATWKRIERWLKKHHVNATITKGKL